MLSSRYNPYNFNYITNVDNEHKKILKFLSDLKRSMT